MNIMRQYRAALSEFAQSGNRYALIPTLTARGKAAGLTADDIIADARQAGVCNRDADIRRMYNGSTANTCRRSMAGRYAKPRKPEKKTYPAEVRNLIAWGQPIFQSADLMAASPVPTADLKGIDAARAMLTAMFKPDDLILIGTMKRGVDACNLRPMSEWLTDSRLTAFEQVKINPFTGKEEIGSNGKKSRLLEKCVARFPLMLLEFDGLPLQDQCRFWAGMIEREMPIVSIVYSGGKSLHGVLRVGAANASIWAERCEQAKALFCADPDEKYRADIQAMRPAVAVRLAGSIRQDTKREQRLLYLDPTAGIAPNAQEHPIECTAQNTDKLPPKNTNGVQRRFTASCSVINNNSPLPPEMPPDDAPLDDIIAAFEVMEAWQAAKGTVSVF